jgi:hypothetical protein
MVESYDNEIRKVAIAIRSAQLHENMDEDIVYSVFERYSRKASEPTTTSSSTTSSLRIIKIRTFLIERRIFLYHRKLGKQYFLRTYQFEEIVSNKKNN